jgi:hypothetical protein
MSGIVSSSKGRGAVASNHEFSHENLLLSNIFENLLLEFLINSLLLLDSLLTTRRKSSLLLLLLKVMIDGVRLQRMATADTMVRNASRMNVAISASQQGSNVRVGTTIYR